MVPTPTADATPSDPSEHIPDAVPAFSTIAEAEASLSLGAPPFPLKRSSPSSVDPVIRLDQIGRPPQKTTQAGGRKSTTLAVEPDEGEYEAIEGDDSLRPTEKELDGLSAEAQRELYGSRQSMFKRARKKLYDQTLEESASELDGVTADPPSELVSARLKLGQSGDADLAAPTVESMTISRLPTSITAARTPRASSPSSSSPPPPPPSQQTLGDGGSASSDGSASASTAHLSDSIDPSSSLLTNGPPTLSHIHSTSRFTPRALKRTCRESVTATASSSKLSLLESSSDGDGPPSILHTDIGGSAASGLDSPIMGGRKHSDSARAGQSLLPDQGLEEMHGGSKRRRLDEVEAESEGPETSYEQLWVLLEKEREMTRVLEAEIAEQAPLHQRPVDTVARLGSTQPADISKDVEDLRRQLRIAGSAAEERRNEAGELEIKLKTADFVNKLARMKVDEAKRTSAVTAAENEMLKTTLDVSISDAAREAKDSDSQEMEFIRSAARKLRAQRDDLTRELASESNEVRRLKEEVRQHKDIHVDLVGQRTKLYKQIDILQQQLDQRPAPNEGALLFAKAENKRLLAEADTFDRTLNELVSDFKKDERTLQNEKAHLARQLEESRERVETSDRARTEAETRATAAEGRARREVEGYRSEAVELRQAVEALKSEMRAAAGHHERRSEEARLREERLGTALVSAKERARAATEGANREIDGCRAELADLRNEIAALNSERRDPTAEAAWRPALLGWEDRSEGSAGSSLGRRLSHIGSSHGGEADEEEQEEIVPKLELVLARSDPSKVSKSQHYTSRDSASLRLASLTPELRVFVTDLVDRLRKSDQKVDDLSAALRKAADTNKDIDANLITSTEDRVTSYRLEVEKAVAARQSSEAEVRTLRTARDQLSSLNERLVREKADLADQLCKMEQQYIYETRPDDALRQQLAEARKHVAKLVENKASASRYQADRDKAQAYATRYLRERNEARKDHKALDERRLSLQRHFEELQGQLSGLRATAEASAIAVKEARAEVTAVREEIALSSEREAGLKEELEVLQSTNEMQAELVDSYHKRQVGHRSTITQLETTISGLEGKLAGLHRQSGDDARGDQASAMELAAMRDTLAGVERNLAATEHQRDYAVTAAATARQSSSEAAWTMAKQQKRLVEADTTASQQATRLDAANDELARQRTLVANLEAETKRSAERISELDSRNSELQKLSEEASQAAERGRQVMDTLRAEKANLMAEAGARERQLDALTTDLTARQNTIHTLAASVSRFKAELDTVNQSDAQPAAYLSDKDALRNQLYAANERLTGHAYEAAEAVKRAEAGESRAAAAEAKLEAAEVKADALDAELGELAADKFGLSQDLDRALLAEKSSGEVQQQLQASVDEKEAELQSAKARIGALQQSVINHSLETSQSSSLVNKLREDIARLLGERDTAVASTQSQRVNAHELETANDTIRNLQKTVDVQTGDLSEKDSLVASLRADLVRMQEGAQLSAETWQKGAERQASDHAAKMQLLEARLSNQAGTAETAQKRLGALVLELGKARAEVKKGQADIEVLKVERAQAERMRLELEVMKTDKAELVRRTGMANSQLDIHRSAADDARSALATVQADLEAKAVALAGETAKAASLQCELDRLTTEIKTVILARDQISANKQALSDQLGQQAERIRAQDAAAEENETALQRLVARAGLAEAHVNARMAECAGLQAEMETSKKEHKAAIAAGTTKRDELVEAARVGEERLRGMKEDKERFEAELGELRRVHEAAATASASSASEAEEKLKGLESAVERSKAEMTKLREAHKVAMAASAQEAESKMSRIGGEKDGLSAELSMLRRVHSTATITISGQRKQLADAEKLALQTSIEWKEEKEKLVATERQIREELQASAGIIADLGQSLAAGTAVITAKLAEVDSHAVEITHLRSQIATAGRDAETARSERTARQAELDESRITIGRNQSTIDGLKVDVKNRDVKLRTTSEDLLAVSATAAVRLKELEVVKLDLAARQKYIGALEEGDTRLQSELNSAKRYANDAADQATKRRAHVQSLEAKVQRLEKQAQTTVGRAAATSSGLASLQNDIGVLAGTNKLLQSDLAGIRAELDASKQSAKTAESDAAASRNGLAKAALEVVEKQRAVDTLQAEVAGLQAKLDIAAQTVQEQQVRLGQHEVQAGKSSTNVGEMRTQLADIMAEGEQLREEKASLAQQLKMAEEKHEAALKAEVIRLEGEVDKTVVKLRHDLDAAAVKEHHRQQLVDTLRKQVEALTAQVNLLQSQAQQALADVTMAEESRRRTASASAAELSKLRAKAEDLEKIRAVLQEELEAMRVAEKERATAALCAELLSVSGPAADDASIAKQLAQSQAEAADLLQVSLVLEKENDDLRENLGKLHRFLAAKLADQTQPSSASADDPIQPQSMLPDDDPEHHAPSTAITSA